jgi:3-dehydroquinate synthetase
MRFAARLAVEAVGVEQRFVEDQDILLGSLGLKPITESFSADVLYERMLSDKKVRNGELRFVFAGAPGTWETVAVDPDLVKIYLIYWEQARM